MAQSLHVLSGKLRRWPWLGISLGLATWILLWLLRGNPLFVEVVYSRGLYWLLRYLWDYTLGWLPFPWLYLVLPGLIWLLIRELRKRKQRGPRSFGLRLRRAALGLAGTVGIVIAWFYLSWGINYLRVPVETQLGFQADSLTEAELWDELAWAAEQVQQADSLLARGNRALGADDLPTDLEGAMREHLTTTLRSRDIPAPGRPRGRQIYPSGLLMQLGATGIYLPFVAEGHVDAALPAASRPFVMAHELGHAYGFGDEGSCNFLGWLACQEAEDPVLRYSGALAYWRELANRLAFHNRDRVLAHIAIMPPGIQADLAALKAVRERYPGYFPAFSRWIYDHFLKTQGIQEGIVNYSRVISLVRSWRQGDALPTKK